MTGKYIKWFLVPAVLVLCVEASFAQRKKQTRPASDTTKPQQNSNYGQPQQQQNSNYGQPQQQQQNSSYGNANTAGANNGGRDTSLPLTVIKGSSGLLNDSIKPSLRNDAAVEQNLIKDRTPLAYENIREDDAVFRVRVWRDINTYEKMNLPFRYAAEEDNGSQRFIAILLQAIKNDSITAFSGADDRFTTPITYDQALAAFGGGSDTVAKRDADNNVIGYEVRARPVSPDSIKTFRLKEEWIFDKETSRLYVRILGIAPVMAYTRSDGTQIPGSERPLWWVYYPDMRPVLSKYEVYNPKNYGSRMSWEELFESRMFSSYIVKSTMDNPFDVDLAQMYPNNTLFRLLEGDHIKEKIFDYEQSLWQY
ncbi:MAG TPA: gliding motility protein GldN [Chitinophagaceae bacterium]|nr:gliding motility protein GldN [Chitinophagaceae bacterium]